MPKLEMSFHNKVSLWKSFFRIMAGAALMAGKVFTAGGFLIFAEVLGIIEEVS